MAGLFAMYRHPSVILSEAKNLVITSRFFASLRMTEKVWRFGYAPGIASGDH